MRYKSLIASLLLVLMLLAPLTLGFAQGDDRIVVPFDHNGPMRGLSKLDNIDQRLVYALQDEKGTRLDPRKVRNLKSPLYLPKGVKLDIGEYRKFLGDELRAYGRLRHLIRRNRRHVRSAHKAVIPQVGVPPHVPTIVLEGPTGNLTLKAGETTNVTYAVKVDDVIKQTSTATISAEREKVAPPQSAAWTEKAMWLLVGILMGLLLYALLRAVRPRRVEAKEKIKITPQTDTNRRDFDTRTPTAATSSEKDDTVVERRTETSKRQTKTDLV